MRALCPLAILLFTVTTACGDDSGGSPADAGPPDAAVSCNVLYLNFEGATLVAGEDDAPNNISSIVSDSTRSSYSCSDVP